MALREARNEQATGGHGVLSSKGLRSSNEWPMAKGEIEVGNWGVTMAYGCLSFQKCHLWSWTASVRAHLSFQVYEL